jgi:hypothetical protein
MFWCVGWKLGNLVCSTLALITAASVCLLFLTSGQPLCKQSGGHRGEELSGLFLGLLRIQWAGTESQIGISSMFYDNVSSSFQRRSSVSCYQSVSHPFNWSPQTRLLAKEVSVFLTVWRQRSAKGQRVLCAEDPLTDGVPTMALHITWCDRKTARLKSLFLYSWSYHCNYSLHPEDSVKSHQHHLQMQWRRLFQYGVCRNQTWTS